MADVFRFRAWLVENEQVDFSRLKDIILNFLELDPNKGLSQPIDSFNRVNLKSRLQGLGAFASLPPEIQQKVSGMIDGAEGGTIGDLIRTMATQPQRM